MHRVQSIRNQCLTLISSLIEVFGDTAVQAILLVIHNMMLPGASDDKENPWMANFKQPRGEDDDIESENEEESKVPMQEGIDVEQVREEQRRRKEAKEFRALLTELVYISKHANNAWKRREVAILLITTFIKDVSAFLIRNPLYELLQDLFDQVILTDFSQAPATLKSLLTGRSLQCATAIIDCDIVPRGDQGDAFKQNVMVFAFEQVSHAKAISVQLMAIRTLIRFSRRFKEQ